MSSILPMVDNSGHTPACPHYGKETGGGHHLDQFCDCHNWEEPRILEGGTNIAWPTGWTQQMAADWREKNKLAPPSEPGSGP